METTANPRLDSFVDQGGSAPDVKSLLAQDVNHLIATQSPLRILLWLGWTASVALWVALSGIVGLVFVVGLPGESGDRFSLFFVLVLLSAAASGLTVLCGFLSLARRRMEPPARRFDPGWSYRKILLLGLAIGVGTNCVDIFKFVRAESSRAEAPRGK